MTKHNILRLAAVALVLLGFSACTTQKNTWLTRTFHNTCAHYNGYFWGKLAYDEGIANLNQTHKDDYTDIIPVYVYPDPTEAPAIYPNMSRAIKKADTMIQKHTITDKAKREIPDAVHYIKYCYLLLAQAHLYKNDLLEASDELEYATKQYKKTDFKYEALIWQARTDNQLGSVSKSEEIIDLLKSSKKIPKKLYPQVFAVIADWNMRIGQYPEVEAQLNRALKVEKDKKVKARYYFIIGQIAERDGDNKKAYDCYTQCLTLHPYNELDFEARIKRALLYMGGAKENERIKENLYKMLKPTKYIDDRDQIYYALGKIAMKEKNETLAEEDYHKSVKASTNNPVQKAISYLSLGDLAFNHEDYKSAKKFYDSTVVALPKKYRGRDSIVEKKENLDRLIRYINVIDQQDSLQRIAKRGQKGAEKYVDSLMAAEKKKEEEKKEQEKVAAETNQTITAPILNTPNGKWYFYNPSAVSQGITEFTQRWGNRPLEDNWRRSKKVSDAMQLGNNENGGDTTKSGPTARKDSARAKDGRYAYMKNIPFSEAQMKNSNDTMIEAYYNVGFIYEQYVRNFRKSEADYEAMLLRFPENHYKLIAYYELYKMYTKTGDMARADYYKNILLTKYPETEYAMLIKDPEKYRQQQEANRQEILKIYESTLKSYKEENYAEVLNNCTQVDSLYPKNDEMAKFAFMEAAAIGHAKGIDAYKNALEKVVILYPKDTVKVVAQSILDYLNKKPKQATPPPSSLKPDTIPVEYSKDEDTTYYYILTIDNKQSGKVNIVRNAISDMNTKIYSQNNFTMDDIFLNSNKQMLVIHKFQSASTAKDYCNYINTNPDLLKALPAGSYQSFYISDINFHILFKHGKSDEYVSFFNENLK